MKKLRLEAIPKTLKSLGFGGVLGYGTARAVFLFVPPEWKAGFSVQDFALVGTALGTLVHTVTLAIAPTAKYFGQHLELCFEERVGWITAADTAFFRQLLQREHYMPPDVSLRAVTSSNRQRRGRALKQVALHQTGQNVA